MAKSPESKNINETHKKIFSSVRYFFNFEDKHPTEKNKVDLGFIAVPGYSGRGYREDPIFVYSKMTQEQEVMLQKKSSSLEKSPLNWISFYVFTKKYRLNTQQLRRKITKKLLEGEVSYCEDNIKLFINQNYEIDFFINEDYIPKLLERFRIYLANQEDMLPYEMYAWLLSEFEYQIDHRLIWSYVINPHRKERFTSRIPSYTIRKTNMYTPEHANMAWDYFTDLIKKQNK